jgi:hypothetical protein
MSEIDWSSINLRELPKESVQKLSGLCHKLNKFDNFLIQFVLIVIMVHQLAIIYNAERAVSISKIANKCLGAPAEEIQNQASIAVWAARVGFAATALMLLIVRSLDAMSLKAAASFQILFGSIFLITFIVCVACASIAKGKTGSCSATQPPNQIGDPVKELDTSLSYMVNWSAVGVTASLLYVVFYSFRAFSPGSVKSAGEILDSDESATSE